MEASIDPSVIGFIVDHWTGSTRTYFITYSTKLFWLNNHFHSHKYTCMMTSIDSMEKIFDIAEGGFDPPTSGLWAQHASSAPLC